MKIRHSLLLALAVAFPVCAHETATRKPAADDRKVAREQTAAPKAGAMRIYRDPVTGELSTRPPRDAAATDQAAAPALLAPNYDDVYLETLPDGTVHAHGIDGQFQRAVSVRRQADGTLTPSCVQGAAHTHADGEAHEAASSRTDAQR